MMEICFIKTAGAF